MADGALEPKAAAPASAASGAGVPVALRLAVYDDLAAVEPVWRNFEAAALRTPFQSFDWLVRWQRHVGAPRGTRPAVVLGRDGDGAVRFILPLSIERRGGLRRLRWLGSELCDYNAPLLATNPAVYPRIHEFRRLWQQVVRLLQADPRFRFDVVDLEKMPARLGDRANPMLALAVAPHPSRAFVATLGRDWDAYYAARRSASTRKTERKQLKRLAEFGEPRLVEPVAEDERAAVLDTLVAQKRRAFARMGADDIFARPGHVTFYRAVAADPAIAGFVHVARLDVGGRTGAASLALSHGDTYALVLSSYDDGDMAAHGPGRAHLHGLLRRAIARGYARFDFTIGDEPYKRDWCNVDVELYDHLSAGRLRAVPAVISAAAFRRAKRLIKQTPALWHVFTRLRAAAGTLAATAKDIARRRAGG